MSKIGSGRLDNTSGYTGCTHLVRLTGRSAAAAADALSLPARVVLR